ncbi:glutamate-rich protein 2 isoform X1 [Arvicola amphibius]|uniref:glutamate-rich protein 2 isoform X1 n=1 Tax=Arvicola amphibius TaxID=1047088 RepID=UPI0018E33163|nr:glutamate-rich protein 2 isoform X1 [Arvicola amphibius]
METDLPLPLSPAFLKVTRVRAQVCPRVCAPNLTHSVTPRPAGRWATRAARSTLRVVPSASPTPGPPPARSLRPTPGPPRSAPLAPPLRPAVRSLGGSRGSRGSSGSPSCLHGDAASQARSSEPSAGCERVWPSWSTLRGISLAGSPAGWGSGAPRLPRHRPRSLDPEFCIPEIPRNYLDKKDVVKASKSRPNGTLLVFDPKEKVMIDPNKTMPQCFGRRPRLASKLYSSPTQISLGIANTFSAKKELCAKKTEDKVSSKSSESRPSSRSIENKDVLTNQQSDLWLSSFLKERAGEVDKDTILAKHEKNSAYCLEDIEEKLSGSTDGDDDDDTNDEDDEGPTKKETRAPLELMAEFLRAEMGRDYQLAKKLCQMILIYEPENPVAKEFFSLIEEILLKEKAQKQEEEEEEDSEEGTSSESEAESSEEGSEDSSDECEDGS